MIGVRFGNIRASKLDMKMDGSNVANYDPSD